MIGVLPKPGQLAVVQEFFELFKTPWELYHPGRAYDVVIATADEIPDIHPKVLFVLGPGARNIDARLGFKPQGRRQGMVVGDPDKSLPIYGELLTFAGTGNELAGLKAGSASAGVRVAAPDSIVIRLGYDLFEEVRHLLTAGQSLEYAHIPSLEIHIAMLRDWMVEAGVSFIEIPPVPAGRPFVACLTHDIDFVGIRRHFCDHSMWGFVYRATAGALVRFARGRLKLSRLLKSWLAAASLPLVYAGWIKDFWAPFEWYLRAEKGLGATYFLIPFKRRPGDRVPGPKAAMRATAYDVTDLPQSTAVLLKEGCELGVHGIDAWHDASKGRDELERIAAVTGQSQIGTRMHWLLYSENTPTVLEQAGYDYDSTCGYNETVGYRAGTSQVFRPLGATSLLELPLHVQDGALFYPNRLNLSEPEAEKRCHALIENAKRFGGVLTLLWHDRSHGPERFWGDFYKGLLAELKARGVWFATAAQVVSWFRKRREVQFERMDDADGSRTLWRYNEVEIDPPLIVRVHLAAGSPDQRETPTGVRGCVDILWNGTSVEQLESELGSRLAATLPGAALSSRS